MAVDYATILARVRVLVMDGSSLIWSDSDLQAGIRLALQELNLRGGTTQTLKDLDGAAATTLAANLEGVLAVGSAAYAARARAVDRAEAYELANEGAALGAWAEGQAQAFEKLLEVLYPAEQARTAGQKTASTNIFGAWADDFGEKGELDH